MKKLPRGFKIFLHFVPSIIALIVVIVFGVISSAHLDHPFTARNLNFYISLCLFVFTLAVFVLIPFIVNRFKRSKRQEKILEEQRKADEKIKQEREFQEEAERLMQEKARLQRELELERLRHEVGTLKPVPCPYCGTMNNFGVAHCAGCGASLKK